VYNTNQQDPEYHLYKVWTLNRVLQVWNDMRLSSFLFGLSC